MENGHITGSFDIFECVIDGVGLQFEGGKKRLIFPYWDEIEAIFADDD